MIKALINGVVILGLSDYNLKLLQEDKPIKINLKDIGLPPQVVYILHGKTEVEIKDRLLKLSGVSDNDTKPHQN